MMINNKDRYILLVDDMLDNTEVLEDILNPYYKTRSVQNGKDALEIMQKKIRPDLVILDVSMPKMDGYEVCRELKRNPFTSHIPVIFLTGRSDIENETKGFDVGAADYISKPISPRIVLARVRTHLSLFNQKELLEEQVRSRTLELNESRLEIIRRLGMAAEFKDNETGLHVIRMSNYAKLVSLAVGMNQDGAELMLNAAPMHDIGKIGISDNILLKPGKLDEKEWKIMQNHPYIGERIIGNHANLLLETARIVALTHHEKWDGSGYPKRLSQEDIPLSGRIVAIADVFDALTSERPYKRAWSNEDALDYIRSESGKQFDPAIVSAFLNIFPEIVLVKEQYTEEKNPKLQHKRIRFSSGFHY